MLGGLGAPIAGSMAGCLALFDNSKREESRTHDVGDDTTLSVQNENGSVTIETFDGDDVQVEIEFQGPSGSIDEVSVTDERTDDSLSLVTEYEDETVDVSTSLSIRCPSSVAIGSVQTSNGSIDIDIPRVDGDAEVVASNGSIDAALSTTLDAAVTATTENGSIDIDGFDSETGIGSDTDRSVTIGEAAHALALETSNGSIDIDRLNE